MSFEALAQPVLDREQQYVLNTYTRHPVVMDHGAGVYLWDVNGNRYLDLMSGLGVSALGHAHPRLVAALADQAGKLLHLSNLYTNRYQGELAEKLCHLSGMSAAFFSNGGAEAVEGAMKLARSWARQNFSAAKHTFVALEGSYHGRSYGSMSVTGQLKYREMFGPAVEHVRFARRNDITSLRGVMDDSVCAILIEPLIGEGGVVECSTEFLQEARRLAEAHNALLIFDEIQCGLGRTGRWFAFQEHGVSPDVLIVGKPLGGGLPLSAFLVQAGKGLRTTLAIGQHGSTLGGSPIACRAGVEFLAVMEEENLLAHIREVGGVLRRELLDLADDFSIAVETRGRGVIHAVELTVPARPIQEAGLERGLMLNSVQGHILRFLPPYILQKEHVYEAVGKLRELLGAYEPVPPARLAVVDAAMAPV